MAREAKPLPRSSARRYTFEMKKRFVSGSTHPPVYPAMRPLSSARMNQYS